MSSSLETILSHITIAQSGDVESPLLGDIALFVALSMATFAVLFGTRHVDATEHQDGLMLAIATESIVKLFAFLAVGIFVTFWMFGGPGALMDAARHSSQTAALFTREPPFDTLVATTLLSFVAIILVPRQFHVAVVENNNEAEIKRAAWMFPIYLVLINLFVVPIALAGMLTFPAGSVDSDMFVLALPLQTGSNILTIAAFVGGLSAATAMVIVESVALSIMVSNDLVMPLVLQRRGALLGDRENVGSMLLTVRRLAIFAILLLAYMYYRSAGAAQLASIGLLSFAAIAQLAPAFFGGLFWRRATAGGAIAGMCTGVAIWAYTLLLPTFADIGYIGQYILTNGPWGIAMLRPQHLFGLDLSPLVHGVVWSLAINILAYVGFSLRREPTEIERLQANTFVPPRPDADRAELQAVALVGDGGGTHHHGGALSRRGAHAHGAGKHSPPPTASAWNPRTRATSGWCAMPSIFWLRPLAAPRLGWYCRCCCASARSRPRRRSSCSTTPMPRFSTNREILQTALDHVRQGHFGVRQGAATDLLEPAVRRNPRSAAELGPLRLGARRDPALQPQALQYDRRAHRRFRSGPD